MSLRAGELRWCVRVQRKVASVDPEYGGSGPEAWVDDGPPVFCKRTNMLRATAEAVASGAEIAPVQVRFDMRPRPMDAAMRLVGVGGQHDGVVYNVVNVALSNDRSELAVIAVSGAENG